MRWVLGGFVARGEGEAGDVDEETEGMGGEETDNSEVVGCAEDTRIDRVGALNNSVRDFDPILRNADACA